MRIDGSYQQGDFTYFLIVCPRCGMRFGHVETEARVRCPRTHYGTNPCGNETDLAAVRALPPYPKGDEATVFFEGGPLHGQALNVRRLGPLLIQEAEPRLYIHGYLPSRPHPYFPEIQIHVATSAAMVEAT